MPLMVEQAFRQRMIAGERLVGTFVKTPTVHPVELLARAGMDFVVLDQEHAPFDRATTDVALFAAHALGLAALVRVPSAAPDYLLSVLDCGATGVLVPHIKDAATARAVADAARYSGSRGYSGSVRSAGYGGGKVKDIIAAADRAVTVIAQIEDAEALDHLDAIAMMDGIDALFIGRGDLSVSLGADSSDSDIVRHASERIAAAARAAGKSVMVFVGGVVEAQWLGALGATAFIYSSDQGFMRQAATAGVQAMRALATAETGKDGRS